MSSSSAQITVPRFYRPWPHQQKAWARRRSGRYDIDIKLWCRQSGKDTDDIEYAMDRCWYNHGLQCVYVGLDNVWINNNIFKKTIGDPPRYHWADYPEEFIHPKDTSKEVLFSNGPSDVAASKIKFIGFLNDQQLIGSSYDLFNISEASLYGDHAFSFLEPIWDSKLAQGKKLMVHMNGTPRGMRNVFYDFLRTYTGEDDPEAFPGGHEFGGHRVFVDKVTIDDVVVPDGQGGFRKLYTPEQIEHLQDRYIRQFGNLNFFNQEYRVDFTTVAAGLVYQGIAKLRSDGRFCPVNVRTDKPVYMAFDISSKGKLSDATAGVAFQFVFGRMVILDWFEDRSRSLIDCVHELSQREWFRNVRAVALPWDSERSPSSMTPKEECEAAFPNIQWHALSMERVDRGIDLVRRLLPNMLINSDTCDYVMECFESYEYRRLSGDNGWKATPEHSRWSHLMDAVRYAAMFVSEAEYLGLDFEGNAPKMAEFYEGFSSSDDDDEWESATTMHRPRKRRDVSSYGR